MEEKNKHKKELEECQKQKDEYLAGWQRAKADLINYKKGEMERMGQIVRYASEELMCKILPILDNLERAEEVMPEEKKDDEYFKGFLQIKSQVRDLLKSFGVEEIEALGKKFDPNFHEVVGEAEGGESGEIKEVLQKGYTLQEKVIRPAKVKIVK
ncbi:MAG: nucleotide exchange factor GrpE [Candidatus Pacebacteria bacterium]|jgi:molecular chaperone GrpE|nr:nucleotide exchange factor GrpE [Candidatus Paceibacterota bacterium]